MLVDGSQAKIPVTILRVLRGNHEDVFSHEFVNLPFDPSRQVDSLLHLILSQRHPKGTSSIDPSHPRSDSFSYHKFVKETRPSNVEEFLTTLRESPYLFDDANFIGTVSPSELLQTFSRSMFTEESQIGVYELIVVEYTRSTGERIKFEIHRLEQLHALYWEKNWKEEIMDIAEDELAHPEDEECRMISRTKVPYLTIPGDTHGHIKNIMVREDYKMCYRFIVEEQGRRTAKGVVVTGQPGIGKTFFLVYCLLRRLSEGSPTLFSLTGRKLFYLGHLGVFAFGTLDVDIPSDIAFGTWVLVDVGGGPAPPESLTNLACTPHLFIIQTTSPDEQRYKSWKKDRSATSFCMDPWAWDEIWAGSFLQGDLPTFSAKSLRKSFEVFGSSARIVYTTASSPTNFSSHQGSIQLAINGMNLDKLQRLFEALFGTGDTAMTTLSNTLVIPRRNPDSNNGASITRVEIASKHIFKLLVDRFSNTLDSFASGLTVALKGVSFAASSRGYLHEAAVHRFFINPTLSTRGTMPLLLRPMKGSKKRKGSKTSTFQVRDDSEAVELTVQPRKAVSFGSDSLRSKELSDSEYYIPKVSNNASFDAFFVLDNTLHVLQITAGKNYGMKQNSTKNLQAMLKPMNEDIKRRWRFVCVVPCSRGVELSVPNGIAKKHEFYTLELDTGVDGLLGGNKDNNEGNDDTHNENIDEVSDESMDDSEASDVSMDEANDESMGEDDGEE